MKKNMQNGSCLCTVMRPDTTDSSSCKRARCANGAENGQHKCIWHRTFHFQ